MEEISNVIKTIKVRRYIRLPYCTIVLSKITRLFLKKDEKNKPNTSNMAWHIIGRILCQNAESLAFDISNSKYKKSDSGAIIS